MKYLEDSNLASLTALLNREGGSLGSQNQRAICGRIEAFTMKRAGADKKTAFQLGTKYVAELQELQEQRQQQLQHQQGLLVALQEEQRLGRKRSQSAGLLQDVRISQDEGPPSKLRRQQRGRSSSFDVCDAKILRLPPPAEQLSGLGDFAEQGTRRLMTDLILTMNLTFPDYDFSSIKATDFKRVDVSKAMSHVNERLSEIGQGNPNLLSSLWTQLDGVIDLQQVDVYTFQPLEETDVSSFLRHSLVSEQDATIGTSCLWSFNYFFVNKRNRRLVFFPCIEVMRILDDTEFEQEGFIHGAETVEADFDMDPASSTAGGIPISTI